MNAPAPAPTDPPRRPGDANLCPATQLAVPECSCPDCLTQLMQAYAPALLAAGGSDAQPALS